MNSHGPFFRGQGRCRLTVSLFLAVLLAAGHVFGREIVDMSGRRVTIPDTVGKVVGLSPPATYLLYAIAPDLVGGLNFPLWDNEKNYTVAGYRKLPVIGGMVGQGRTINQEVLLAVAPDFVLHWVFGNSAAGRTFEAQLAQLAIPRVDVRLNSLTDYPAALQFLGDLLQRPERGALLRRYAEAALTEVQAVVAKIPEDKRVAVYYAEGLDGLATERAVSTHAELIPLAGGKNVHAGEALDNFGMEKIAMEQLLLYDPEVILVKEKTFFATIFTDPRWQGVRAVKNGRVHLIPHSPFNWFDRPPSFMRLLGARWLLGRLHPERYRLDMVQETRNFYRLFLGVELSDHEAREVLEQ